MSIELFQQTGFVMFCSLLQTRSNPSRAASRQYDILCHISAHDPGSAAHQPKACHCANLRRPCLLLFRIESNFQSGIGETNQMTGKIPVGSAILFSLLVSACGGGGGGGGGSEAASIDPQGVYAGSISTGTENEHNTLVLENGEFYSMYGVVVGGALGVTGFLHGHGTTSNGKFTSSDLTDFFWDGTVTTGTLTATYAGGTSFNGAIALGADTVLFTGSPLAGSRYEYNAPANLAHIDGTWNLTDLQGAALTLNVSPNGTFAGFSGTCSFTGKATPRPSGKNVFDVVLAFGSAPCPMPGQTVTGIALEYQLDAGVRQLIVAMTAGNTEGIAFLGTR